MASDFVQTTQNKPNAKELLAWYIENHQSYDERHENLDRMYTQYNIWKENQKKGYK